MQNQDNRFEQTGTSAYTPTKNYLRFDKLKQTLHGLDKIIQDSKSMIQYPYQDIHIQQNYNSHINRTMPSRNNQQSTQIDIKILSNFGSNKKTIHIDRPDNSTISLKINGQIIGPINEYKGKPSQPDQKQQFPSEKYEQHKSRNTPSQYQDYFQKIRYEHNEKNSGTTKSFTPPYIKNQFSQPFVKEYEQQYFRNQNFQQNQQDGSPAFPILSNSKPLKKELLEKSHLKNSISSRKNRQQINVNYNSQDKGKNYFSINHQQTDNGGNIIKIQQNYPDRMLYSSEIKIKENISYQEEQNQIVQQKKFDINIQTFQNSSNRKSNQQKKWNYSRPNSHTSSQRDDLKIKNQAIQNRQYRKQAQFQEPLYNSKLDQQQDYEEQQQKKLDEQQDEEDQQQKQFRQSQILKPVDQPLKYGNQNRNQSENLTATEKTSILIHKYRGMDKCKKTYAKKQRSDSYQTNKSLSPKCRQITERLAKSKSKIPCPKFLREQHHDKLNSFRAKIKQSYGFIESYISQSDLDKIYKQIIEQDIPQHKWAEKAVDFVYKKVKTVYTH